MFLHIFMYPDLVLRVDFFQVQELRPTPSKVWPTLIGLGEPRSTTSKLFPSSVEYPCNNFVRVESPQHGSFQSCTKAQHEHAPFSRDEYPAAAAIEG